MRSIAEIRQDLAAVQETFRAAVERFEKAWAESGQAAADRNTARVRILALEEQLTQQRRYPPAGMELNELFLTKVMRWALPGGYGFDNYSVNMGSLWPLIDGELRKRGWVVSQMASWAMGERDGWGVRVAHRDKCQPDRSPITSGYVEAPTAMVALMWAFLAAVEAEEAAERAASAERAEGGVGDV